MELNTESTLGQKENVNWGTIAAKYGFLLAQTIADFKDTIQRYDSHKGLLNWRQGLHYLYPYKDRFCIRAARKGEEGKGTNQLLGKWLFLDDFFSFLEVFRVLRMNVFLLKMR